MSANGIDVRAAVLDDLDELVLMVDEDDLSDAAAAKLAGPILRLLPGATPLHVEAFVATAMRLRLMETDRGDAADVLTPYLRAIVPTHAHRETAVNVLTAEKDGALRALLAFLPARPADLAPAA